MGGALAIAASQYRKICAAVACYGLPPAELCVVQRSSLRPVSRRSATHYEAHVAAQAPPCPVCIMCCRLCCPVSVMLTALMAPIISLLSSATGHAKLSCTLQPGRVDSPVQIHVGTKDSYLSVSHCQQCEVVLCISVADISCCLVVLLSCDGDRVPHVAKCAGGKGRGICCSYQGS